VVATAVGGGLLLIAGVLVMRRPASRPEATGPTLTEARVRAAELLDAGRIVASLPLLRRASGLTREIEVHRSFARALYRAGYERGGSGEPAMRSSFERVALMREAISEMEIVNRLPVTPPQRADALLGFAEMMLDWGFPWETFVLYRKAQDAEPSEPLHAARAEAFMTLLEHPDRYSLAAVPTQAVDPLR